MRYLMKQKLFSFGDRFNIQNGLGEDVGYVQGKAISFGDNLTMFDVRGQEVAKIEQRVMSWGPTYEISRNGYLVAIVKKELFRLTPRFSVDVPGPDDLEIEGDFWSHEYFVVRQGKTVAQVSKGWWTVADTYGVEVLEDEDHILILACTIVVDCILDDEHRRR